MANDLDFLQGTWTVAELELDGESMVSPGDARIVIKGNRFTSTGMGDEYARIANRSHGLPVQFERRDAPRALQTIEILLHNSVFRFINTASHLRRTAPSLSRLRNGAARVSKRSCNTLGNCSRRLTSA